MAERYNVQGRLGRGGIGAVYKAYDNHLDRDVAIKRLLPIEETNLNQSSQVSLKQEARALASLSHPNIVTIFEFSEDDEGPYVVFELIEGDTLTKIIESGALSETDFYEVADQILDALIAAHARDILHRDIKPANIMLSWLASGRFQIKMLDFGLAKFSEKPSTQTLDQSGSFLGSIDYIAPEQIDLLPLDQRTDLYSLGCVLYFSLTQFAAFKGKSMAETMTNHSKGICIPLEHLRPDLPIAVCRWVMSLMARNPDDRPSSALKALEGLNSAKKIANEAITDSIPTAKLAVPVVTTAHPTNSPLELQDTRQIVTTPSPMRTIVPAHPNATAGQTGSSQRYQPKAVATNPHKKAIILLASAILSMVVVTAIILLDHNKGKAKKEKEVATAKKITPKIEPVAHPSAPVVFGAAPQLNYENSGKVTSLPGIPQVNSLVAYYSVQNPLKLLDGRLYTGDGSAEQSIGSLENTAPRSNRYHLLRSPDDAKQAPKIGRTSKLEKTIYFYPNQKFVSFAKGLSQQKVVSDKYTIVILCRIPKDAGGGSLFRMSLKDLQGKDFQGAALLGYSRTSLWLRSNASTTAGTQVEKDRGDGQYQIVFVELDSEKSKFTFREKTRNGKLSENSSIELNLSGKMQLSWYEFGNVGTSIDNAKRIEMPCFCIFTTLLSENDKISLAEKLFSEFQ